MSTRQVSDQSDPIIEDIRQLAEPMVAGEKPRDRWRLGTEHEKQVFDTADHHAPSYGEPGGIRDLLLAMQDFGWTPIEEGGHVIAMKGADGNISLEPAGQLELSGAPLADLHQTWARHARSDTAGGGPVDPRHGPHGRSVPFYPM